MEITRFQHENLTARIIEACFEVSNELGSGFLESVYQNSLQMALQQKGLNVQEQVYLSVTFRGNIVGEFVADMVVENLVLLELKAVAGLLPEHKAQTINYLKAGGYDVGLLVNFGKPRLEFHRLYRPGATLP
ncbi:MAG: GxxExxY protein [Anaerolineales bacterium]|nr:GxxExxY protein [Anaerolineales bacterium]